MIFGTWQLALPSSTLFSIVFSLALSIPHSQRHRIFFVYVARSLCLPHDTTILDSLSLHQFSTSPSLSLTDTSILLASAARLTKLAAQTLHRGLETHAAVLSKIRAALLSNPRFRSSPASFTYPAAAALGLFSSWASSTSTSELHDAVSSSAYRSISTGSTGGGGGRGGGHCAILLSARDIAAARKIVYVKYLCWP